MLRKQWKFSMNPFFMFQFQSSVFVSWTLAAHLVFSSHVCCLQNLFEAPEITESDE